MVKSPERRHPSRTDLLQIQTQECCDARYGARLKREILGMAWTPNTANYHHMAARSSGSTSDNSKEKYSSKDDIVQKVDTSEPPHS